MEGYHKFYKLKKDCVIPDELFYGANSFTLFVPKEFKISSDNNSHIKFFFEDMTFRNVYNAHLFKDSNILSITEVVEAKKKKSIFNIFK